MMNLNQTPTKEQLRSLLAEADDNAGHHVLWVDTSGEVHVSQLGQEGSLTEFSKTHPTVRVRFEAWIRGNGYVGPDAASDDAHVTRYFNWLKEAWASADGARPGEIFVD